MGTVQIAFFAFGLAAMLITGCGKPPSPPPPGKDKEVIVDSDSKVKLGMAKAKVVEAIGEPSEKTEIIKNPQGIFGVIEGWWDNLKDGDKIEVDANSGIVRKLK